MFDTDYKESVAERAGDCPFCDGEVSVENVTVTQSYEYDEEYYGVDCPECNAVYSNDMGQWRKPTPPGEQTRTVSVEQS